jgi:hypothetical protein
MRNKSMLCPNPYLERGPSRRDVRLRTLPARKIWITLAALAFEAEEIAMFDIDVVLGSNNQGHWQFEAMPAKGDLVQGPHGMHTVQQVIHTPGVNGQAPRSGIVISPAQ